MTLGIALCGDGFILVAADRQQTVELSRGGRHTLEVCKINRVGDSCVFVTAGPDWGGTMFQAVAKKSGLCSPLTDSMIYDFTKELAEEYAQPRVNSVTQETGQPSLQFLLAGFDDESGPVIYALSAKQFLPLGGHQWWAIGCSAQSQYFLKAIYRPDAVVNEMALLACFCIRETHMQDPLVGPTMDVAVVRRDGIHFLPPNELEGLSQNAEMISEQIRRAFPH